MYSNRFSALISRFPESADGLRRLEEYFRTLETHNENVARVQLPPQRLAEIAGTTSISSLSKLLILLLEGHVMRHVLIIESPSGGTIAELSPEDSIPPRILDWRQNLIVDVTFDNIASVYRPVLQ